MRHHINSLASDACIVVGGVAFVLWLGFTLARLIEHRAWL